MNLFEIEDHVIPERTLTHRNKKKMWEYGYDSEFDIVIISKDGTVGEIYNINGLKVALPECPDKINYPHNKWIPEQIPAELAKIKTRNNWDMKDKVFKDRYVDYINDQFDRRELGYWFINNSEPTYITGSHYMYLTWSKIDVGLPHFREANRVFFIYWEACKADHRCFGMCYVKNRRSGFSFMASSEVVNVGTLAYDSHIGINSKTGTDAKKMFTGKVVPISNKYPFFFKPIQDGMSAPKTELAYRVPAKKITRKTMIEEDEMEDDGLNTVIDWANTDNNSYDGQKLLLDIEDEAGKIERPGNIVEAWDVRKTCLKLGSRIIGKCMMGSTVNALSKGGSNFKHIFDASNPRKRTKTGQTESGLYALFIPMEWNYEGAIDEFGHPVFYTPVMRVIGEDGRPIRVGAIDDWESIADSLKDKPERLNEHYRQFPRTVSHAFRDEAKESIFNLTKIYDQVDWNDGNMAEREVTQGYFTWKNGVQDSEVIFVPDKGPKARFFLSWIPPVEMRNNWIEKRGIRFPLNEHIGAFGCDSYDISGAISGGSNGALHGSTKFNMTGAPSNVFFLEYVARPATAEIFFEEVLMAIVFYGMPILAENNKPRLLYHLKNRGYRGFSMNRPDKPFDKLSVTEKELGGIPSSSEDVLQAHSSAIESYIERFVGYDRESTYRPADQIGIMPFNRTLDSWSKFDIRNRTAFDASISSGLSIMANQKHIYLPEKKKSKISIKFARYDNSGNTSRIIY